MRISERIFNTIEDWQVAWKVRLKGWLVAVLSFGLEVFMDVIGKAASPKLTPLIDTLQATGEVPPELQPILDEIKNPKGEVAAMFAQSAGMTFMGGAIGQIIDAIFRPLGYFMNRARQNLMPDLAQLMLFWLRGHVKTEDLPFFISSYGFREEMTPMFQDLSQIRLDPASVITAWRRDKPKYEKLFKDLRDQGWDDERIEALKFFTLYYPSPAELIHWTAREVFEPDMVKKYGLRSGIENLRREDFYKAGMDDTQIDNHWIAHWEHASWVTIIEMLHRGIITEQDVKDWFPLVEMAPYWAENLIKIAYTWPTRVDVRRWWDMRTIDEPRLKELYEGMGYRGDNLKDYIKWTKVYTDFPMMIARFKNGWITEEDIRNWLRGLEIPEERITHFIQEKTKPEKPERVAKERDLTKTDIYRGVKKGVIRWSEGLELLQDLGYDEAEAEYILRINVEAAEGSPEGYFTFKRITQLYRASQGLSAKVPSEDVIQAEDNLREAERILKQVEAREVIDITEAEARKAVDDAIYRYRQLLIQYKEQKD